MSNFHKGILFLFVSVLLYSIMPVLIRMLGAESVPPASQVFLRYIVAFVCAVFYFRVKKQTVALKKTDILLVVMVSLVGYALTNLFFTYSILLTQVGTVLFIFYCFSIMTPILGNVFLKEKINAPKFIALILGFTALFFLFKPGAVDTWKMGAFFALLSAVGQSVYIIGRKKLSSMDSATLLLANTFVGVVAVGIISFLTETRFYTDTSGIGSVSLKTWVVTVLFGIDNFAAWLFMTRGFQLVTAGTGSLVMLAENLIGLVFAFLFFREIPTVSTLIGGGCILAASILVITRGEKA